jgi:hypothetical protein
VRAAAARALRALHWGRPPTLPGPSDEALGDDALLELMVKEDVPVSRASDEQVARLGRHVRQTRRIPTTVETDGRVIYLWATLDGFLTQLAARVEALARIDEVDEAALARTRLVDGRGPSVATVAEADFLVAGACLGTLTALGFGLRAEGVETQALSDSA